MVDAAFCERVLEEVGPKGPGTKGGYVRVIVGTTRDRSAGQQVSRIMVGPTTTIDGLEEELRQAVETQGAAFTWLEAVSTGGKSAEVQIRIDRPAEVGTGDGKGFAAWAAAMIEQNRVIASLANTLIRNDADKVRALVEVSSQLGKAIGREEVQVSSSTDHAKAAAITAVAGAAERLVMGGGGPLKIDGPTIRRLGQQLIAEHKAGKLDPDAMTAISEVIGSIATLGEEPTPPTIEGPTSG